MPQHIGIVACSAEGATLCYRTICLEGTDLLGPHNHPEISMHGHPFAAYVKCIEANDWPGVAELMLTSAEKLAKAGADFLIAPVNTVHQAFDLASTARRAPGYTLQSKSPVKPSVITTSASAFWVRGR